mgnify:CR=1 FL=1
MALSASDYDKPIYWLPIGHIRALETAYNLGKLCWRKMPWIAALQNP